MKDYHTDAPCPYADWFNFGRFSMTNITAAGVFPLGDRTVNRVGYGAMQLAGPGVFGPPRDRDAALAVLREAVATSTPATSMAHTSPTR
jgi:hypothetical protein